MDLEDNILYALALNTRTLNPLITIFLVHDKRLFSILSNKKIMKRYLKDKSEVALL